MFSILHVGSRTPRHVMIVANQVDFNHVEESVVFDQVAQKSKEIFVKRAKCLFRAD